MPKEPKKNPNLQDVTNIDTDLFAGGMTKDPNASIVSKEQWTHARNAINNSSKGDLGTIGNEPSNLFCTNVTYPVIGTIYLYGDKWILFSTDNTTSEIGIFDDSECKYTTLVNDATGEQCPPENCLNFSQQHLITGASKENFDCTWQVYWDDGLNPSRTMNVTNIPWKTERIVNGDCVTYEPIEPKQIDCDLIRLAPFLDTPNLALSKSDNGGQLRNGSYQVFLAYTVNGQQIGDYIGVSNVQSLFDHEDMTGALDVTLTGLDKGEFEEFKLVVLSNWQSEQQAKELGLYSVETTQIGIDYINQSLPTVPIELLPLRNPAYEKSEKMYVVNDYLIRSGPTERFDFNYQPLANQIETWWTSTLYPADYYANGGNKTNFMRDEVYSFFIRWIYDTGEKSSSFHIPGRGASHYDPTGTPAEGDFNSVTDPTPPGSPNCLDTDEKVFQTFNTSIWGNITPIGPFPTDDGGSITHMGYMGYWESTEKYPHDPVRWNANVGDPELDLCGKPIRHHKMPHEQTGLGWNDQGGIGPCTRNGQNAQTIKILGVKFGNIPLPRLNPETVPGECDEEDSEVINLVPGIVGYEILVGSRAGNKSIIAKGIARNMREVRLPADAAGNTSNESFGQMTAVIANYPFNDIGCDPFLHNPAGGSIGSDAGLTTNSNPKGPDWAYGRGMNGIPHPEGWSKMNMFTFHSPETSFDRPFLSPYEIQSYGSTVGGSIGIFKKSEKHPGEKLINSTALIISVIIGAGYAIAKTRGKRRVKFEYPQTELNMSSASAGGAAAAATALAGGNAAGLVVQQAGTATSESIHTTSAVLGAPGLGGEAAHLVNTGTAWGTQLLMVGGSHGGGKTIEYDRSGSFFSELPAVFQPIYGVIAFMQSVAEGGNHILELIYNLCSYVDYAFKYNGHGLYRVVHPFGWDETWRTKVEKARYVKNTITNLSSTVRMNNLFRPATVAVLGEEEGDGARIMTTPTRNTGGSPWMDNSKVTMRDCNFPSNPFSRNIAAHYCGLKLNFENQYGQIDQIKQIPITNSEFGNGIALLENFLDRDDNDEIIPPDINTTLWSLSLYGGDTYINRYTEKVIMPFFWDFLKGQPDGFVYDYRLRANVMFPMYWANFERYDLSKLVKWIVNLEWLDQSAAVAGALPNGFYHLDNCDGNACASGGWGESFNSWAGGISISGDGGMSESISDQDEGIGQSALEGFGQQSGSGAPSFPPDDSNDNRGVGLFHIKDGYFYTHSNGINDFFVESEYNVGLRDYEDTKFKRHYDWLEFTDLNMLFDADVESAGNFYKYDKSLSISNLVTQQISSGEIQPRYYDPVVAESCWTHYPKRLIYSLQAQKEATKDYWRVFLPNNYKDFKNKVNVIKPISKSGAVILFPHLSPQMWQGVDQLQTDLGTKITIGDGGLFSQPQQNLVNADLPHEYGSCESARGVINTPTGLFYISQAQGKIFHMQGQGINNIADKGMKQWFNKYLPSKLIQQFPEIENHPEWSDNPIAGVGCQSVYDPNYDIVYFCKKDYEFIGNTDCVQFVPGQGFVFNETQCSGASQIPCCPEGFSIIPELSTLRCSREWWVSPSPSEETNCNEPYDIIFVIYGGDRINNPTGNNNTQFNWGDGDQPAKQTFTDTMTYTFQGLQDSGLLGNTANDSQVMIMQFDGHTGLNNHYIDYTGNLGVLLDFANNGYMNPDYVSEAGTTQEPEESDPAGATWWALEWGYRKGRPGVKKMLIEIWAAYDSVCNLNFSGVNDNEYPTLVDCNSCFYEGFDSPPSYIENGINYTPIAPAMVDIIADNIGEPGSLGFDRGLNDYGFNNSWWTPVDETLFVGPVCSPQEQGQFDNYLEWKNNNVFDTNCRYQDPNHPDFDGELTVIGVWFSPWNYMKCTNDGANNNGCNIDPMVSGTLGYPNNHPNMLGSEDWGIGALPTQGNIDYTIARSSPGHAIWSPMSPGPNQGSTPLYGQNVASEILALIPCNETTTDGLECPIGCMLTETTAGQMECYCAETLGEPDGYQDNVYPINITDTSFFRDISWTVSFDPKSQSWISFHDWHPELVMPSFNHFLTTKSWIGTDPICPPGMTYNSNTEMCEQPGEYYGLDSIITIDDIKAPCQEPAEQISGRKMDIIFSLDVSWSTVRHIDANADLEEGPPVTYEGTIYKSQLEFIDAFAVAMADQMTAGEVQIGIIAWNDQVVLAPDWLYYPTDDITKLDLTNSLSAIRTFLGVADGFTNPNYTEGFLAIASGPTDITRGFDAAKGGLDYILKYPTAGTNAQGNSYLGSRQGEDSFERHAIFVTDAGPEGVGNLGLKIEDLESNDNTGLIDTSSACFRKAMENLFWGTGDNGLYAFHFDRNNLISPNVDEGFAEPPLNTPATNGFGLQANHWMDMVKCECTQNVINDDEISSTMSDYSRGADPSMNINMTSVFTNPDSSDQTNAYTKNVFPILKSFNESSVPVWELVGGDYAWDNIAQDGTEYLNTAGEWEPFSAVSMNVDSFQTFVNSNAADLVSEILPLGDTTVRDCRRWCPDPDRTLVWLNGSDYTSPFKLGNVNKAVCRKVSCECDPIIQDIVISNGWNLDDPNGDFDGNGAVNVIGDCPDFDPLIYAIGSSNFSFWDYDDPDYRHPHCCVTDMCQFPPNYDRGSIWKHNIRCDSYANYYGVNYPWEIEWVENTGQHVYTVRNVEYQMEAYIYKGDLENNCGDRFHDLDWNFDEAVIYNTEQVSGLLKLNLTPKNNAPLITEYPIIGASDIEILYSKEEQKYRFNQFWDTTFDRGEFNAGVSNSIFLTQLNGYIRDLNQQNLDYNKPALQRKKFRHYYNKIVLRKNVSGNRKMILKLANTKLNMSHR